MLKQLSVRHTAFPAKEIFQQTVEKNFFFLNFHESLTYQLE